MAEAPSASVAMVQVVVPVPPAEGLVQANAGPVFCDSETNVVLDGVASVSEIFCASEGPLLVMVRLYVSFVPALTGSVAALLLTPKSAEVLTVVFTVDELLPELGSLLVVEMVAVFERVELFGALGLTWTTKVKVAEAPLAMLATEQFTVPVAPTDGVVQANAAPVFWVQETKVVLVGTVSLREMFSAVTGPLLVTVRL